MKKFKIQLAGPSVKGKYQYITFSYKERERERVERNVYVEFLFLKFFFSLF